jgi:hypothetical protein
MQRHKQAGRNEESKQAQQQASKPEANETQARNQEEKASR